MNNKRKFIRLRSIFIAAINTALIVAAIAPTHAMAINSVLTTTPPTIDGGYGGPTEWPATALHTFTTNFSNGTVGENRSGGMYVMNDGSYLYVAISINSPDPATPNWLRFAFDNTNNGVIDGDDFIRFYSPSTLADHHFINSSGCDFNELDCYMTSCCTSTDLSQEGDGAAAYNTPIYPLVPYLFFEFRKPLNSDDSEDISIGPGDTVGFAWEMSFDGSNLPSESGLRGHQPNLANSLLDAVNFDEIVIAPVPIFYDNFNSDTPGTAPIDANAIGSLNLSVSSDGSILTRGPGHGFSTNYVEIQRDSSLGCGSGLLRLQGFTTTNPVSGVWTVTWRSVAYQTDSDQNVLQLFDDPASIYAFWVAYRPSDIVYGDMQGDHHTGITYEADTPKLFKVVIDMDNKTFDLYIEDMITPVVYGQPVPSDFDTMPTNFSNIGLFNILLGCDISNLGYEAYGFDDMKIYQGGTPFDASDPCAGSGGDTDGDGVCGNVDNCPNNPNASQADTDADGIGDVCDTCTDTDLDGYGNPGYSANTCDVDNCPSIANPDQVDDDKDGLGNVCDDDWDNDGILNSVDSCQTIFDSGDDSDGDAIDDACDNCRYDLNPLQTDSDNDLLGDACDNPDPNYGINNVISLASTIFNPGKPFWVTAEIQNKTAQEIQTLRPDCYNTYLVCPGARRLCRRGPAYGIPKDKVKIPAGASFFVKCDLNDQFESFPSSGTLALKAIYENKIQDPDYKSNPTNCTEINECYKLWIGEIASNAVNATMGAIYQRTTADVSFNPDRWDEAWATGNSPPISVKISNIVNDNNGNFDVGLVDLSSITINGSSVEIIPASNIIVDGALYFQIDRHDAVIALGSITSGIPALATVQGKVGDVYFSGTRRIDILKDSGTVYSTSSLHTVACGTNPGAVKTSIVGMEIRAYDASAGSCAAGYGLSWQHWGEIWSGCPSIQSQGTYGHGEATFALPQGSYLMIGKAIESGDVSPPHSDYIGRLVDVSPGVDDYQYFQVIKTSDQKTHPAKSKRFTGSDLLVIEPEYVEWSSDTELYPFVFDSVGDWAVTTSVTPPEGFVSDYDSLSATVNSDVKAVQFTITDVGSKWVPTKITHKIKHKKNKEITFTSDVGIKLTPELAQQKGTGIYGDDQGENNDDQGQNDDDQSKGKKK